MNSSTDATNHENLTCSFELKYKREKLINIKLKKKLNEAIENLSANNEFFGDQMMSLNAKVALLKQ